jgi:hypothetical protein
LSGSVAKIARANEHFEALKAEVEAINRERNPYAVRLDRNGNSSTYSVILCAGDLSEPRLGVILGDILHNLRCALDYIIVALVEKSGATLTTGHQFPIFDDQGEYEAKTPRMLFGVTLGRDEVTGLQPFNREKPRHDPLFALGYFSNADKHRIIPSYLPVIGDLSGGVRPVPASVETFKPPNYMRPGKEFEIAQVTFAENPRKVDFQGKIAVAVPFGAPAFGKHSKGLGAPFGFFKHVTDHVAMIVDTFKAL